MKDRVIRVLQRKVCEGKSDSVLQRKVNICEGQSDSVLQREVCEGQSDSVLQRKVNICEGQGDKGPSEKGTHIWWTGRLGFRERCTCCLYRTGGLGSLKVPKREIFDRSDFPNFYTIKSSWVGNLFVKILTYYFNFWGS